MADALLDLLNSNKNDEWKLINDTLKSNNQYTNKSCDDLRQYLSKLVTDKKIEVKDNKHNRLGIHTALNMGDSVNTLTDLDNWPIHAKITELGKDKIQSTIKMWYDSENARRQFEDYPITKRRANAAIIIAIISTLATIILGLLKLKTK